MLERIHSLPYPWVFLFFWCLARMRSHTMYWIGRGITAGPARTRWVSLLESPVYARAQAWSARWGVLAVPTGIGTAEMSAQRLGATAPKATTRSCHVCLSEGHQADSKFCRHCGAALPAYQRD